MRAGAGKRSQSECVLQLLLAGESQPPSCRCGLLLAGKGRLIAGCGAHAADHGRGAGPQQDTDSCWSWRRLIEACRMSPRPRPASKLPKQSAKCGCAKAARGRLRSGRSVAPTGQRMEMERDGHARRLELQLVVELHGESILGG